MSGNAGNPVIQGRYSLVAPVIADGDSAPVRLDVGAGLVVSGSVTTNEAAPTAYSSGGDAQSGLIGAAGARNLREIQAFNATAGTRYLQLHDAAALPANGAIPIWTVTILTAIEVNKVWNPKMPFAVGAFWTSSTTRATLTLGGVADMFVTALYDT